MYLANRFWFCQKIDSETRIELNPLLFGVIEGKIIRIPDRWKTLSGIFFGRKSSIYSRSSNFNLMIKWVVGYLV